MLYLMKTSTIIVWVTISTVFILALTFILFGGLSSEGEKLVDVKICSIITTLVILLIVGRRMSKFSFTQQDEIAIYSIYVSVFAVFLGGLALAAYPAAIFVALVVGIVERSFWNSVNRQEHEGYSRRMDLAQIVTICLFMIMINSL